MKVLTISHKSLKFKRNYIPLKAQYAFGEVTTAHGKNITMAIPVRDSISSTESVLWIFSINEISLHHEIHLLHIYLRE